MLHFRYKIFFLSYLYIYIYITAFPSYILHSCKWRVLKPVSMVICGWKSFNHPRGEWNSFLQEQNMQHQVPILKFEPIELLFNGSIYFSSASYDNVKGAIKYIYSKTFFKIFRKNINVASFDASIVFLSVSVLWFFDINNIYCTVKWTFKNKLTK